jgi:EAL domain-containing protein (putative c-di-GMP-specific phosphodiesterase class I)
VPIGEWVLNEACAAATRWPSHTRVAVNLSPVQFKCRNLVEQVLAALAASGLEPNRLEIEINEAALLGPNEQTLKALRRLREAGLRIAMDDFGTGYSSLSHLRSFPFDKVKIDRSFVNDLASDEDRLAIVKAVIGLGRNLGIASAAEGVESEAQLALVREHGCSEVQGFLFGQPLPAGAVTELLTAQRAFGDTAAPLKAAS